MPHDPHEQQQDPGRYESVRVSVRGLLLTGGLFLLSLLAIIGGLWWLYHPAGMEKPSAHLVEPPPPRLQPSPGNEALDWQDLEALNHDYFQEFKSRGWVTEDGRIRVPDAIAQRVIAETRQGAKDNQ